MRIFRERQMLHLLKPLGIGFAVFAALLILLGLMHAALFGPAGKSTERAQFLVEPDEDIDAVARSLEEKGLVRFGFVFQIAYALTRHEASVRPGGYVLYPAMDAWTLARTLGEAPYLAWIVIPEGVRREQVAGILARELSWTKREEDEWIKAAATTTLPEGIFYADTYLIPSDQSPDQIAQRFRARFEEAAREYMLEAAEKGMRWEEVVTLASLIERESAKNDKALVSGILWNRLNKGMLLQVDATLQYALGTDGNWWPVPTGKDKYVESPYNTYEHAGLPPTPIATPSLASIHAALNPDTTACLYYLHDNRGRIHCATTYRGHVANVNRYLK
jgi:UPF0755 protein